jgi:hypothetical protein
MMIGNDADDLSNARISLCHQQFQIGTEQSFGFARVVQKWIAVAKHAATRRTAWRPLFAGIVTT